MTRNGTKTINVHLSKELHGHISTLREIGLTLSSVARLAIKKYGADPVVDEDTTAAKAQRVILYLAEKDYEELNKLSSREGRSRADILRCLMTRYLKVNKNALESLL